MGEIRVRKSTGGRGVLSEDVLSGRQKLQGPGFEEDGKSGHSRCGR